MTLAMLHVVAHLPHAWHVTTWHHGWYAWREWHSHGRTVAETFGQTRGILCGYLRTLKG